MAIRALDLVAKLSSRFAYEILPVTMASVIGAVLVNHYGHQPPSPPIVVQAPASASENAIAQSLRDEHEFIAAFMKRDQENASGEDRAASAATQVASLAAPPLSLVDPPLPEPRPMVQKTVARLSPKPAVRKKSAPPEAPALGPDLWLSRRRRFSLPRRPSLKWSSSRDRGRSSASPAKWAGGSQTSLKRRRMWRSCPPCRIGPRWRRSIGR